MTDEVPVGWTQSIDIVELRHHVGLAHAGARLRVHAGVHTRIDGDNHRVLEQVHVGAVIAVELEQVEMSVLGGKVMKRVCSSSSVS